MLDPMRVYCGSAQTLPSAYENLDEEQLAQRYGETVSLQPPLWNQIWLRVGMALIETGEKLTAANAPVEWTKKTV